MKNILYIVLSLVILTTGQRVVAAAPEFVCTEGMAIPIDECNALVAFYDSGGGDNWTFKTGWKETTDFSTWYGVTVTENVTGIKLNHNNVNGLTPEVEHLTQLTNLELQDNYIWAGIPTAIGNLNNLEVLRLDNSELHGVIPTELGNLTKLKILRLNDNILTGDIPGSLKNLTSLADPGKASDGGDGLDLDRNRFNIPPDYPNPLNEFHTFLHAKDPDWHLLQWGDFVNCAAVFDIPVIECEALVALYNSTNGPEWNNHSYWLETNAIGGWYGVEVNSGHVTELFMPFNNMNGDLPPELGNLTQLAGVTLYDNNLTGNIPPGWGNATDMYSIYLYSNELSGPIPPELGNLTKLHDLFLGGNHLTGNIPAELGKLTQLVRLTIGGNQLSGNIPPALGSLTALEMLSLGGNQLSGSIPAELGSLINLKSLDFNGNYLSGDIPGTLINLVNLYDAGGEWGRDGLYLDNNYLNVPPDYPNLANPLHAFLYSKDPDWQLSQKVLQYFFLPVVRK